MTLSPEILAFLETNPNVQAALRAGIISLSAAPGHFTIRIDGGPDIPAKVELSAGVVFKVPKTA